jgi:hypothetical protein
VASSSRSGESVAVVEDENQYQPVVELVALVAMAALEKLVIDLSFRRCSWNRRQ